MLVRVPVLEWKYSPDVEEINHKVYLLFDKALNFRKIDGYADYLTFVNQELSKGTENMGLKEQMNKIVNLLNALKAVPAITGIESDDFNIAQAMSNMQEKVQIVLKKDHEPTPQIKMLTTTKDMSIEEWKAILVSENHSNFAFTYDLSNCKDKDYTKDFHEDIKNQLFSLKMSLNPSNDWFSIMQKEPIKICEHGYLEPVTIAVNQLIQGFIYCINCYSYRNKELAGFDKMEIDNYLHISTVMLQNVVDLDFEDMVQDNAQER